MALQKAHTSEGSTHPFCQALMAHEGGLGEGGGSFSSRELRTLLLRIGGPRTASRRQPPGGNKSFVVCRVPTPYFEERFPPCGLYPVSEGERRPPLRVRRGYLIPPSYEVSSAPFSSWLFSSPFGFPHAQKLERNARNLKLLLSLIPCLWEFSPIFLARLVSSAGVGTNCHRPSPHK